MDRKTLSTIVIDVTRDGKSSLISSSDGDALALRHWGTKSMLMTPTGFAEASEFVRLTADEHMGYQRDCTNPAETRVPGCALWQD